MSETKCPIESGEVCRRHNCMKCCIETEMPLTEGDIKLITSLGYKTEDFAIKDGKEWKLKNVNGKCVFLNKNGCKIYDFRPQGCRLYPLVYDETTGKPVLDELCPYRKKFRIGKDDIKKLLKLIEKLKVEI